MKAKELIEILSKIPEESDVSFVLQKEIPKDRLKNLLIRIRLIWSICNMQDMTLDIQIKSLPFMLKKRSVGCEK